MENFITAAMLVIFVSPVVGAGYGELTINQPTLQYTFDRNTAVAREVCHYTLGDDNNSDGQWAAAQLGVGWYYEAIRN